jgi:hypothetical protein
MSREVGTSKVAGYTIGAAGLPIQKGHKNGIDFGMCLLRSKVDGGIENNKVCDSARILLKQRKRKEKKKRRMVRGLPEVTMGLFRLSNQKDSP